MKLPSLTKRAEEKIARLMKDAPKKKDGGNFIPVIVWIFSESGNPNFIEGPFVGGGDEDDNLLTEIVVSSDGRKIAYGLPRDILDKYKDHQLDFDGKGFKFVP